jgi:hypothetical protein
MGIFLIWILGVICTGAYALYRYGRTEERDRYAFEELSVPIVFAVLLWPTVLPLAVPGYLLFKTGEFFYNLGVKHREKK